MLGESFAANCSGVNVKSVLGNIRITIILSDHFSLFCDTESAVDSLRSKDVQLLSDEAMKLHGKQKNTYVWRMRKNTTVEGWVSTSPYSTAFAMEKS
jgi:hypothetical protein